MNELGIEIRIAHYPPYTPKYNPIERRLLFSFAVERTLKEIADNFLEPTNEATHFCLPNLELKPITLTDSSVLV